VLLFLVLFLFVIARVLARPPRTRNRRGIRLRPGPESTVSGPGRSPRPGGTSR
jgi:hypothetical protein